MDGQTPEYALGKADAGPDQEQTFYWAIAFTIMAIGADAATIAVMGVEPMSRAGRGIVGRTPVFLCGSMRAFAGNLWMELRVMEQTEEKEVWPLRKGAAMSSRAIVFAVVATSVSVSAFAQYNERRDDHDRRGRPEQFQRGGPPGQRGPDFRPDRRDDRRHDDGRRGERGAGPRHDFYKGGRLPMEYRNRQYVVNDWRLHHLHAPPRGYHWVQAGADYVLVQGNTGIIVQVVINP